MDWEYIGKILVQIVEGMGTTLELFALTLVFSIPLGFLICFGRMSKVKPVRWISQFYILIFRGTPLMLQLIFFWFGFLTLGIKGMDRMFAAVLAFSLNYAAYFSEIFRSGIQAVPKGQYEAADVLGLNRKQTFRKIVLPQVMKTVLPPVGNEVITLVKDTALVSAISMTDILRVGSVSMQRDMDFTGFVIAAIFYLALTSLFTFVLHRIEKRFDYYKL